MSPTDLGHNPNATEAELMASRAGFNRAEHLAATQGAPRVTKEDVAAAFLNPQDFGPNAGATPKQRREFGQQEVNRESVKPLVIDEVFLVKNKEQLRAVFMRNGLALVAAGSTEAKDLQEQLNAANAKLAGAQAEIEQLKAQSAPATETVLEAETEEPQAQA